MAEMSLESPHLYLFNNAANTIEMEMELEVKSEHNSGDERCCSTASFVSFKNETEDEVEDEQLVEINAVTVPQEIVEDKRDPSLLLFVNRNSVESNQASYAVESSETLATCSTEGKEFSKTNSITKVLRNVKKNLTKSRPSIDVSSTCNGSGDLYLAISGGQNERDNESNLYDELSLPSSEILENDPFELEKIEENKTNWKDNENRKECLSEDNKKNHLNSVIDNNCKIASQRRLTKSDLNRIVKDDYNKKQTNKDLETCSSRPITRKLDDKNYNCHDCGQSFKIKLKLSRHLKIHEKKPESYNCHVCEKSFKDRSALASHSRAHNDIRDFKCDNCKKSFKTKAHLFFHMKTHEEAPFVCEKCNKTFPERKMLVRHNRVVHSEKFYTCALCGRKFRCAKSLERHITIHSGKKAYSCEMCDRSFVYKSTFVSHMRAHEADDRFNCEQCPSGTKRRACTHYSDARPWLCNTCGKGFPERNMLKYHMKTHDHKPHKCDECGKTFRKKETYESHLRKHEGIPKYMCDKCSNCYFTAYAFKRHYMKHTSQKTFFCDVCKKAFWVKDALKAHKRTHLGVKQFQCTQCSKCFTQKHSLSVHLRMHSDEPLFQCSACSKKFTYKSSLDRHSKLHTWKPMLLHQPPRTMPPQPLLPPQHLAPVMPLPPPPLTQHQTANNTHDAIPLPPTFIMMAPPKHTNMPALHILQQL